MLDVTDEADETDEVDELADAADKVAELLEAAVDSTVEPYASALERLQDALSRTVAY